MSPASRLTILAALFVVVPTAAGCRSQAYSYSEPAYAETLGPGTVLSSYKLSPPLEDEILALGPDHVTAQEVRDVLSHAPAPRIINVHGGIYPVYRAMESFSLFLIDMGYPEGKIRNPRDGSYSYSCYADVDEIAGVAAWYYEHQGLRPMMIGHSQGGMQTVKALHALAGDYGRSIPVWNPVTDRREERDYIIDPYSGLKRPVVGLQLSYASAVGAGGIARLMPNQWSVSHNLRKIPDTVAEFTGFYKNLDIIGGDFAGFGSANGYHASGTARVRSVLLPFSHDHYFVPFTHHLADHAETRNWINNYVQRDDPMEPRLSVPATNIVWAADVWTSIKRNWVIELQRMIRARRGMHDAN